MATHNVNGAPQWGKSRHAKNRNTKNRHTKNRKVKVVHHHVKLRDNSTNHQSLNLLDFSFCLRAWAPQVQAQWLQDVGLQAAGPQAV